MFPSEPVRSDHLPRYGHGMARSTDARPHTRGAFVLALGACSALMQPGCLRNEEIRSYTAPKENAIDALAKLRAYEQEVGFAFKAPEGWTPAKTDSIRKAAFQVQDGKRQVEVTVVDLPASAGALLPNVNRWRLQVQLEAIAEEELSRVVSKLQIGGVEASYVELVGPEQAQPRETILGAVAIHGDKAWFFKLKGDAELAGREKERFAAFLQSVTFPAADGAGHGQ